jgi:hypothetical protein
MIGDAVFTTGKAQSRGKVATEEKWFIDDAPIGGSEADAFGHADVASNLKAMIQGSGRHRLMIGLLGGFGVGKSTVIELLKTSLADRNEYGVVRISAERHEQVGFHRSLIFAFAEELQNNKLITKPKAEELLRELEFSTTRMAVDPMAAPLLTLGRDIAQSVRPLLKRLAFWTALGLLAFGATLGVAALFGWDVIGMATGLGAAIGVAVATLGPAYGFITRLTGVQKYFESLLAPGQVSHLKPRVEAADGFERTFANLVEATNSRLVIAVDDIDRLGAAQVLEALNAVRSFQLTCKDTKRPIFIVSVDERIIREAIKADTSEAIVRDNDSGNRQPMDAPADPASAYLNRLFVQQQQMPAHAQSDLLKYAKSILDPATHAGAKALGNDLDAALTVLIYDKINDPRHVIRLLNGFFGDYRIAARREGRNGIRSVAPGTITKNVKTLAQMTVLRIDFPDFYAQLREDPTLIDRVLSDARGDATPPDPDESLRSSVGSYFSLRDFIGRTQGFLEGVPSIVPFLYLGQDDIDKTLGDKTAREIRGMLVNRQIGELRRTIERWKSQGDQSKLEGVSELLVLILRSAQGLDLQNALAAVQEVADSLPEHDLDSVAVNFTASLVRTSGAIPDPPGVIRLGEAATDPRVKLALGEFLLADYDHGEYTRALAVLSHRTTVVSFLDATRVRDYLVRALERLGDNGTVDDFETWLPEFQNSLSDDLQYAMASAVLSLAQRADTEPSDEFVDHALELFSRIDPAATKWLGLTAIKLLKQGAEGAYYRLAVGALKRLEVSDPQVLASAVIALDEALSDRITVSSDSPIDLTQEVLSVFKAATEHAGRIRVNGTGAVSDLIDKQTARLILDVGGQTTLGLAADIFGAMVPLEPRSTVQMAAAFLRRWTEDGILYDQRPVVAIVLAQMDELPDDMQTEVVSAMLQALQPGPQTVLRNQALDALPMFLNTDAGHRSVDRLALSLIQHVSYSSTAEDLGQVINMLTHVYKLSNAVTEAATQQFINSLRNVLSYGGAGANPALSALCRVVWPAVTVDSAMALLAQHTSNLLPEHFHDLVQTLPYLDVEVIPVALQAGIVLDLVDNSTDLASDQIAAVTSKLGLEASVKVARYIAPAVPAAMQNVDASNSEQVTLAIQILLDESGELQTDNSVSCSRQIVMILHDRDPEGYESVLCSLLEDQGEGQRNWTTRDWQLLTAPLTVNAEKFVNVLDQYLGAGREGCMNVLPAADGALGNEALANSVAHVLTGALHSWFSENPDAHVAGNIAACMQGHHISRDAALEVLGRRAPNKGTAKREAYDAAKAALGKDRP